MRTRQRARLEAVALAAVSEEAGNLQCVDEDRDESGSKDRDESDSKDRDESGSDEEIMPGSPNLPQLLAIEKSDPDHVVALDPGPQPDLYFSCDPDKMLDNLLVPLTRRRHGEGGLRGKGKGGLKAIRQEEVMKDCIITPDFERKECAPPITISKHAHKKIVKARREASTGSKWFDMKAPQLTPQLKNDLRLLQMRNALDPSHHYKANDSKKLPRYFQVGRVVADSTDFYTGRIPRRQQKQTIVDELLSSEEFQRYHRKKYLELQSKFMSGTKRYKTIAFKKKFKKI